ncbi:MAG: hypothetical protein R3C53_21175 [Pirellulaceae bacterium]
MWPIALGGGIEAETGTTTNLTNVFLTMNNAGSVPMRLPRPGNGGGLHITGAGNATITGGEVTDNVAAAPRRWTVERGRYDDYRRHVDRRQHS